ncbi:hypothetical protein CBR_g19590 [Chara braunii]|uniref:Uncharacterized protein n=1 Tax=Chara braunii TaxID=69332 RepID=A0A388KYE0_CHABU|nr:hypothetical protein CBR_g19590 [Chara braunii]|eukprot:GBG75077.1 hypothetical protein CBR_g19590 [Chara braunii]
MERKDIESEADYEARLADMMLEIKQRADVAVATQEKREREAEEKRRLAELQQQAHKDAAHQAAYEAKQMHGDALFEEEAEVLTLATDWEKSAKEEGASKTMRKFSAVIKRIAATVVAPSNISDRVSTLQIEVGTLKDGVQLQQTTNQQFRTSDQQVEEQIRAAALSSALTPFTLRLDMYKVRNPNWQACLYHPSGGACQAWLDNLLSMHKVIVTELHTEISWKDLTTA